MMMDIHVHQQILFSSLLFTSMSCDENIALIQRDDILLSSLARYVFLKAERLVFKKACQGWCSRISVICSFFPSSTSIRESVVRPDKLFWMKVRVDYFQLLLFPWKRLFPKGPFLESFVLRIERFFADPCIFGQIFSLVFPAKITSCSHSSVSRFAAPSWRPRRRRRRRPRSWARPRSGAWASPACAGAAAAGAPGAPSCAVGAERASCACAAKK